MTRPSRIEAHPGSALIAGILAADPDISLEDVGAALIAYTVGVAAAEAIAETFSTQEAHAQEADDHRLANATQAGSPAGQHQRPETRRLQPSP